MIVNLVWHIGNTTTEKQDHVLVTKISQGEVVVEPMHEIGNAAILKSQVLTAEKTNALVGRRIRKGFEGRFFEGTLMKVDEYYHIAYDDGDKEDVSLDGLVDIILP